MSKESRKQSQMYCRVMQSSAVDLRAKLGAFNEALRPKPNDIPKALWKWLAAFVIDILKLESALNPKRPDQP